MMLKAGTTARLAANLLGSAISLFPCMLLVSTLSGIARLLGLALLLGAVHGLVLAYRVIDRTTPLMRAGKDGLELDSDISPKGILAWEHVKSLKHISLKGGNDPFGWFDYVMVRSTTPGAFGGVAKILPLSWIGIYLLPTRLLEGGAAAAQAFVREVEVARRDQRFDAAISRAGGAPFTAIVSALQQRAEVARAPDPRPAQPVQPVQAARPALGTSQPLVAARQDMGKAPPAAKPRNTGVLLNGKPLEF